MFRLAVAMCSLFLLAGAAPAAAAGIDATGFMLV